ncbi:hypothetical protein [Halomonas cerina]|uniref:SMODS and SLOG-associating 2TM effector domain-containing protein n=1 Tax=Halomonas cerina TaxID=447424 RepID=A0A839V6M6_9GAMM|nr:hypothetical protein [Halomonas cerina]MBB3189199.1 hypothetical protein [Halomonas cerina]
MMGGRDTLTIGFSGHLTLRDTPEQKLRAALEHAFALTTEAVGTALQPPPKSTEKADGEGAALRLLTGFGPGADRFAVNVWWQGGQGPVHVLFPYLDPDEETVAWTDDPATAATQARVSDIDTSFDAFTALDGAAGQAEAPPRHAHLEVTRWLTGWSQVLIAFWDGKAGGVGGTGDSVLLALQRGIPVLWIRADAAVELNIIDPSQLGKDSNTRGLAAMLAKPNHGGLTRPPEPEGLAELLGRHLALPPLKDWHRGHPIPDPVEAFEKHSRSIMFDADGMVIPEAWWQRIRFGVYSTFVNTLSSGAVPKKKLPRSRRSQLRCFFWRNRPAADAAERLEPIPSLFLRADAVADRLSNRHRSTQIVISGLAILAVAVAITPALVPDWKAACVAIEFTILVIGGLTYRHGKKAGNELVWSDARRLGERLRGLLVLWPLGQDANGIRPGPPASWSEWRVQALRRQIGPPTGRLYHEEMLKRFEAARISLVEGQATYHRNVAERHKCVHKRMEKIENFFFFGLLVLLLIYLGAYGGYIVGYCHKPVALFGNIVLFASAVVPAIGASFIAMESRFDFRPSAYRSAEMAKRFENLNRDLRKEIEKRDGASLTKLHDMLGKASALALTEVDSWRDDLDRRSLIMQG